MGHSAWEDSKRVTRWLGLGSFEGILTHVSGGFCWQLAENLARILAGILIHELFLENIALIFFFIFKCSSRGCFQPDLLYPFEKTRFMKQN